MSDHHVADMFFENVAKVHWETAETVSHRMGMRAFIPAFRRAS